MGLAFGLARKLVSLALGLARQLVSLPFCLALAANDGVASILNFVCDVG